MEERKLVGLRFIGNTVWVAADCKGVLVVVAENVEALGTALDNSFRNSNYPNVPNQPDDDKVINVVIGDSYLLRKVKVFARWSKNSSKVPDDVRFSLYSYNVDSLLEGVNEVIVFKTENGSLVYVEALYTTLLENVIDEIDKEFLKEDE